MRINFLTFVGAVILTFSCTFKKKYDTSTAGSIDTSFLVLEKAWIERENPKTPKVNQKLLKQIEQIKDSLEIKSGTYAGECLEYCKTEYLITSVGIKKTETAWNIREDLPKLPPIIQVYHVDSTLYQKILKTIELENFKAGKYRYGCPDCSDQGGEWFEFTVNNKVLYLECEPWQEIEGYNDLLNMIREVREKNN